MFKVMEGRIIKAKVEDNYECRARLEIELIKPTSDDSAAEFLTESPYGYIHYGFPSIKFVYPQPQLGEIYLLNEEMLDHLVDVDWRHDTLVKHLGEDKVNKILGIVEEKGSG